MIHTYNDVVTVGAECFSVANSVKARFHFVAHGLSSRGCFFGPRVFRALHGMHPHATSGRIGHWLSRGGRHYSVSRIGPRAYHSGDRLSSSGHWALRRGKEGAGSQRLLKELAAGRGAGGRPSTSTRNRGPRPRGTETEGGAGVEPSGR